MNDATPVDCLVIGGGPAGLTAAVYLARFHLSVTLIDAGGGRAATIPRTHNQAAFPEGISGTELLGRMRAQAALYEIRPVAALVDSLRRDANGFVAVAADAAYPARSVLLATGVTNHRPAMPDALHDRAVAEGRLRYCPICDGYEVTDRDVAVFGSGEHGLREARFLRGYTRRVTLIAEGGLQAAELRALGITLLDGPVLELAIDGEKLAVSTAAGRWHFDTAYPAMGSRIHSDLAIDVGAACTEMGCIEVDAHQRTSVPGLYAAGDVVVGLDQLSTAFGHASIAATAIRNDLDERTPLLR
ncbi:NAD(P)/FAD-dependent oxidoreductase [Lichenicoccus sp.]|uniref:NAD(P)/FAD-dependent oxidoreductase n=1 Tax=Lichenicoccus sp. TaxID=2781899 RepID=UPI003D0F7679